VVDLRGPLTRVAASSVVDAPPASVFAFLSDPRNHWLLAGPKVRVLEIADAPGSPIGGVMVIRGPAGIRRRARTRVVVSRDPSLLGGVAELGGSTTAWVAWDLRPSERGGTLVVLSAAVSSLGSLDRILLLAGGKRWIRGLFADTLERLGALGGASPVPAEA
jgi:hypothetical protein